jgi:G3E family GTPase
VGCSLASSLVDLIKRIKRNVDPDLLFIEPSEMVVTREIRDVAAMGLRDIRFDAGPFITLVDGPQFPFLWSERRALLLGQVKDADLVAVSRMDLIGTHELETIAGLLQDVCGHLIPLSVQNGRNMEEVMKHTHG